MSICSFAPARTVALRLVFALSAVSWLCVAQAADGVQLSNEVFREIEERSPDGQTTRRRVEATTVLPGSEVIYVIRYHNAGTEPAGDVVVTNPVPQQLEFVAVLGPGPAHQVSVDGGRQYGDLAALAVPGPDGQPRPATAADVTHVRWTLNTALAPGASGAVSFRARVK